MKDALMLGEKVLALLEESARVSTYKSALLLAMIDRAQEHRERGELPMHDLAERVVELYWPQTVAYGTTGVVLLQNQGGNQATIVREVLKYRELTRSSTRVLPEQLRHGEDWDRLVTRVELTLAEWPVPRLQRPFEPFLYEFDWSWGEAGGWSVASYRAGSEALRLFPGVADGLVSLGPLLRPFIVRWWTEKAAQLNPNVDDARSVVEFEGFLFGRDRVALERIAESLLDLQAGACFYCGSGIARNRAIDHFVPWSRSGDDGLDNLVAACRKCNGSKRATLAAADHLEALLERNGKWHRDLAAIAHERQWPRHPTRTTQVIRNAYLVGSDERPVWRWNPATATYELRALVAERSRLQALFSL